MRARTVFRICRLSAAVVAAGAVAGALAGPAGAADAYPCAAPPKPGAAQVCPLTSPIGPDQGIPFYTPTAAGNPRPGNPPAPQAWIHGTEGKSFTCQTKSVVYYHPKGWRNVWWARTSVGGQMGWVPEVFFRGGTNDERDAGLAVCPPGGTPTPTTEPDPEPVPEEPAPDVGDPCERTPAAQGPRMTASFSHSRRDMTVSYGKRASVRGELLGADGMPVPGAAICVGSRTAVRDAPLLVVGTITTDAQGRFSYMVDAGPTRRIFFVHQEPDGAVSTSVLLRVRARVTLHVSRHVARNGRSVAFSGRLLGAAKEGGELVELQSRRGSRWQTFATTRTRGSGRFHRNYRFTRTSGTKRYSFRVRVPTQRDYPFVSGASRRPVEVRVSG